MGFWESLGSTLIGGLLSPFGGAVAGKAVDALGLGPDKPKTPPAPVQMMQPPQIGQAGRRVMTPPQMPTE